MLSIQRAAEKAMIKQLTSTNEAAGRRCLSGLQVLIKQLTGADQLAEPRPGSPVPSTPERREGLRACYWEGPSELPERRSSRRGSAEPRPRGCSGLGEPRPALPSF